MLFTDVCFFVESVFISSIYKFSVVKSPLGSKVKILLGCEGAKPSLNHLHGASMNTKKLFISICLLPYKNQVEHIYLFIRRCNNWHHGVRVRSLAKYLQHTIHFEEKARRHGVYMHVKISTPMSICYHSYIQFLKHSWCLTYHTRIEVVELYCCSASTSTPATPPTFWELLKSNET